MRFVLTTFLLHFISGGLCADSPPNVILILSSDVPRQAIGGYGTATQTPNIDRLRQQGIRYQIAWSMPTFVLSQRTLLSGRYATAGNSTTDTPTSIPGKAKKSQSSKPTIATLLRKSGYLTLAAGKWAADGVTPLQTSLTANGFEKHCVVESDHQSHAENQRILVNGEIRSVPNASEAINTFLADLLSKPTNQPFFLYYPILSLQAETMKEGRPQPSASQLDRARHVDRTLGKLIHSLEQSGRTKNTLLIFTSIQGAPAKVKPSSPKGTKETILATDSAVRVPFIVQAPFLNQGGRETHDLVDFTDLAPTILEVTLTAKPQTLELDGRSFVPSLKGVEDPFEKRNWIYATFGNVRMIRDWQHFLDSDNNFHDLTKDPFQKEPVSPLDKQAPGRKQRLELLLERLGRELNR